jgi:hypothetical protein
MDFKGFAPGNSIWFVQKAVFLSGNQNLKIRLKLSHSFACNEHEMATQTTMIISHANSIWC